MIDEISYHAWRDMLIERFAEAGVVNVAAEYPLVEAADAREKQIEAMRARLQKIHDAQLELERVENLPLFRMGNGK